MNSIATVLAVPPTSLAIASAPEKLAGGFAAGSGVLGYEGKHLAAR